MFAEQISVTPLVGDRVGPLGGNTIESQVRFEA